MPRKIYNTQPNKPVKIRVRLETRDDNGNVVAFRYRDISDDAASDVIFHAIELVNARRRGASSDVVEYAEDELIEALTSYDLIEEED